MFKYFLLWLPMPLIAIINATVREIFFTMRFDEKTAHQYSTITILILLAIYIYFVFNKWSPESFLQSVGIGIMWCILTVAFEFGLGLANNQTTTEIMQAYDLTGGNLWALVPLFLLISPTMFYLIFQR